MKFIGAIKPLLLISSHSMTTAFLGIFAADSTTLPFKIYPSFEISSRTLDLDEKISGAKIDPLASDQKEGITHDLSSRGVIGTDRSINQSRIDPMGVEVIALVLRFLLVIRLIRDRTDGSLWREE